jgi:hypothetical protein
VAGTWKIPLLAWSSPTGSTVWAPGDGGGGLVLFIPATGGISGVFPGHAAAIYLDGSVTPSDLSAMPAGWTADGAYTFHWLAECLQVDDVLTMNLPSIGQAPTHHGPDVSGTVTIDTALTGCTTPVLVGIADSTITGAMVVGSVNGAVLFGNQASSDPLTWFNGTYTIAASTVTRQPLPPLPTRTPIEQGGQ